jgi:hypothetical protein
MAIDSFLILFHSICLHMPDSIFDCTTCFVVNESNLKFTVDFKTTETIICSVQVVLLYLLQMQVSTYACHSRCLT